MELIFLGTGAGLPSKERNVTSLALTLYQENNSIWLFDCGEGTQHQILHTSIKPRKINKIFITHLHGDHIYGLPGFLSSRSFLGGESELIVYGPPGIKEYIHMSLKTSHTTPTYPLSIVEIEQGVIFEDDMFSVRCMELDHGVQSFGFRLEEKNKQGHLKVEKLKADGIIPGPIYQKIKQQDEVELEDGRIILSQDYIGEEQKGRIISILGDTRMTDEQESFVKDSDVLVHEATFREDSVDLARDYFHSTTKEAATLAKEADVKHLIMTHISARYQSHDYPLLLQEAKAIFEHTDLAHDFSTFSIPN